MYWGVANNYRCNLVAEYFAFNKKVAGSIPVTGIKEGDTAQGAFFRCREFQFPKHGLENRHYYDRFFRNNGKN